MLPSHRALFDVPREVAYLDNGSFTPLPRPVRAAGERGVAAKSTPWAMNGERLPQVAELVRAAAARLVGATAADMAIVPSVAYGIATAAANLPLERGSRVLLAEGEFPSLALRWAELAAARGAVLDVVPRPADGDWTAALAARIEAPGLPPVGVAALTPLGWTDGSLIDLPALRPALRAQGAAIVVDATQAAGVLPLDVAALGADFLAFPTYKWLLGPYTLAFLYVAPHRQGGTPLERHGANHEGGAVPFPGLLPALVAGARRFDMGERLNPVTLPMALAGLELLYGWGMEPLAERLRTMTDRLAGIAEEHGLRPVATRFRAPHLLGLHVPDGSAAALVAALATEGVHVAERGGNVRVGVHVFNDEEDAARLARTLGPARRLVGHR